MIRANISNLKNRLSHYLRLVRAGEVVEIVDRKTPLARIVAVESLQSGNKAPNWLQRMVELGMIAAPSKNLGCKEFARLDQLVSENGKHTGAVDALRKEREEGR
ncbi:MAG: type II toxin-antitoxin system prevent-host-death family antitoxin [Desulfobacterales bacterium]